MNPHIKTWIIMTTLTGISNLVESSKIFPVQENDQVTNSLPPRRYPPIGLLDTIEGTRDAQGKLVFTSAHGTCSIFKDKEILQYHAVLQQESLGKHTNVYGEEEEVYIDFTQNNKAIIQQQATRGCTAATAAMLIKDQGGSPDFYALQERNLGDDEDIKQDIQSAGFKPVVTLLKSNSLEAFRAQLSSYRSAIVSIIDPQAGCHSIIVDEVSEDAQQVRLRDPYHGWEITVYSTALEKRHYR
ncbi:MAG: papain-like cysteine protease family protein [Verrucomicrobiota bacterium]